jgi:hypothetical protein
LITEGYINRVQHEVDQQDQHHEDIQSAEDDIKRCEEQLKRFFADNPTT